MTMQKIIFEESESCLSIKLGTKQPELEWGLGKEELTCKTGVFCFLFFFSFNVCKSDRTIQTLPCFC